MKEKLNEIYTQSGELKETVENIRTCLVTVTNNNLDKVQPIFNGGQRNAIRG